MAGEIVIFAKTGCPHCLHAKQTLRENDLTFKEIVVNDNEKIRQYLKELTTKASIPQIFFNGSHIGGNDDLQNLKADTVKWEELVDDLTVNPTRLAFDFYSQPERSAADDEFSWESDENVGIMKELLNSGVIENSKKTIFSQKKFQSITPVAFINWYASTKKTVEIEGEIVLKGLLSKKFLIPVNNSLDSKIAIESNLLLRLNDGSDSSALNAGPANFCKLENSPSLGKLLRKLVAQLYDKHVSPDGKKVDYEGMKRSASFADYLVLCKELQLSCVEQFSEDEKKAFFLNVYNAMVIHAVIQNGSPTKAWTWYKFFSTHKYIIGGHEFNLDDIESGILRGNKRPALRIFRPFSSSDSRKALMLQKPDPRIHFALNCGLESCPPIASYSAENIDEELQAATESYLESKEGIQIVTGYPSVVRLSSVFKWYATDFGATPQQVIDWIKPYVSGEKKLQLANVLSSKHNIEYMYCDCKSNSIS